MKKKVFKVGDRVRVDPKTYRYNTYCVEYVMTVVKVNSTVITVDKCKLRHNGRLIRCVSGDMSYFKEAEYSTDPITGRRYDECE